jgi:hypothetical protein
MYGGRRQAVGAVRDLLQRRDVTQITAKQLDDATVGKIRELIAKAGREVLSVDHPTDRLEALFLRVVSQAQRDKLATSGAESTGGVSAFLTGRESEEGGRALIETLVHACRRCEGAAEVGGGSRGSGAPERRARPVGGSEMQLA